MRRSPAKIFLLAILALGLAVTVQSAPDPAVRDYSSVQVRLIDHASGYIGIVKTDDDGTETKFAVKADPADVDIRSSLNQPLEFDILREGDTIDLVTRVTSTGLEEVLEIIVYGKYPE
jgi:hypothetical protein